jgi:hypothetical protein
MAQEHLRRSDRYTATVMNPNRFEVHPTSATTRAKAKTRPKA